MVTLSQLPKHWDYRCVPPHLYYILNYLYYPSCFPFFVTQSSLGEEKDLSALHFTSQLITEGRLSRNSRRNLETRTDAEAVEEHQALSHFSWFAHPAFYTTLNFLPRGGTIHSRLSTPMSHTSLTKKMLSRVATGQSDVDTFLPS